MKLIKSTFYFTLLALILVGCSTLQINTAADDNESKATDAINRVIKNGLVVIFPTEYKKEKALINFAKSKPTIQKEIKKLRNKRRERLKIWQEAKGSYTFSKLSIVPDSLLKSYISNPVETYVIGSDGELNKESLSDIYVLFTEYGGFEIKQNGRFVANPFPNKASPAVGSAIRHFIGLQSEEKSVSRFFTELDKKLQSYYSSYNTEGTNFPE